MGEYAELSLDDLELYHQHRKAPIWEDGSGKRYYDIEEIELGHHKNIAKYLFRKSFRLFFKSIWFTFKYLKRKYFK